MAQIQRCLKPNLTNFVFFFRNFEFRSIFDRLFKLLICKIFIHIHYDQIFSFLEMDRQYEILSNLVRACSRYLRILVNHGHAKKFRNLTPWFPPRHGGAFYHLNLDCKGSRRDRDKRLTPKSRAYDSTSPPAYATFVILNNRR